MAPEGSDNVRPIAQRQGAITTQHGLRLILEDAADAWERLTPYEQERAQQVIGSLQGWLETAPNEEAETRRLRYVRGWLHRYTIGAFLMVERRQSTERSVGSR